MIDKLLKLPGFNQILQAVMVEFYCDVFVYLLEQKGWAELDQLKMLRKLWLKIIHPRTLIATRDIILKETNIDVDMYFRP